jgi:hypothetical protein
VESVVLDVEGACFSPGQPIQLNIQTDGPTEIRFTDGRPPVML